MGTNRFSARDQFRALYGGAAKVRYPLLRLKNSTYHGKSQFRTACFIAGVVVYLGTGQTDSALQWLPLASMTIYTAAGSLGLGSLPYVYIGELFSAEMRPVLAGMTIGLAQVWSL